MIFILIPIVKVSRRHSIIYRLKNKRERKIED